MAIQYSRNKNTRFNYNNINSDPMSSIHAAFNKNDDIFGIVIICIADFGNHGVIAPKDIERIHTLFDI